MTMQIEYDKKDCKYIAGDIVSGTIVINNITPIEATGLKISMNVQYKNTITTKSKKEIKIDSTQPSMTENLNSALFGETKLKSKVLSIGQHRIPFIFPSLPTDLSYTASLTMRYIRHFLNAELETKSGANHKVSRDFIVTTLLLDNNQEAMGWQTKTVSKNQMLSLKKMSMKVTVPTAIGTSEKFPIHIEIKNGSKGGMIVRSRFAHQFSVPMVADIKDTKTIKMEFVEELKEANGELLHYLTPGNIVTSNCVVMKSTYMVEVEVETSNGLLLKLEFPVHVGKWKKEPVRVQAPFGEVDRPAEATTNPTTSTSTNPVLNQGSAPTKSKPVPPPPTRTSSVPQKPAAQNEKALPLPVSTAPGVPSAPPLENIGVAPPTYEEAMQDSTTPSSSSPMYPPLPKKE